MNRLTEHEVEEISGIPDELPKDEHLLWQGAPQFLNIARHAFHVVPIALYFAALISWQVVLTAQGALSSAEGVASVSWLFVLASAALAILFLLAYAVHRTTIYSITNKRVIMRIGIALPITLNIPFAVIESASMRGRGKNYGDVFLSLNDEHRFAYAILWPHGRAWRLRRPEPALRSLADAPAAAAILAHALHESLNTESVNSIEGSSLESLDVAYPRSESVAESVAV